MSNRSRDKEKDGAGRPEASLLYSSGSWRPPGASLLPTPLGLSRPPSGRPWSSKPGTRTPGPPGTAPKLVAGQQSPATGTARALDESSLFRPLDVFANALVNSATVEERAVREELQRQTLLFSDQPRASRPSLTSMLSYLAANNAPGTAGPGAAPSPSPGAGGLPAAATYQQQQTLLQGGFDMIPEEFSGASLDYAPDSTMPEALARRAQSTGRAAATGRTSPALPYGYSTHGGPGGPYRPPSPSRHSGNGDGGGGGVGGAGAWFGPPSGSIGKPNRPPSAIGRPVSAVAKSGPGLRPGSAFGGPGAAPVAASPLPGSIEAKMIASMGPSGTGHIRGELPQGTWARQRLPSGTGAAISTGAGGISGAGSGPPAASGGSVSSVGHRPISAPRSSFTGSNTRPPSAVPYGGSFGASGGGGGTLGAKRRASATQAPVHETGIAAAAAKRPFSALPYGASHSLPYKSGSGGSATGPRPPSGATRTASFSSGPATLGLPTTTTITADDMVVDSAHQHLHQHPHGGMYQQQQQQQQQQQFRSPSPTRVPSPPRAALPTRGPPWSLAQIGEHGRPMSALSAVTAASVAVAASMAETVGHPPAPYRGRAEFLQSGKKIPKGCRPLSAFSTLPSATPRGALSPPSPTAGAPGGGVVVPLADSVVDQPVYTEVDGPIRTSYDVVDYFSAFGQNAQKKLFYLNARAPSSLMDVVSPFDLLVVPAERADRGQHWTMSALGVVEVLGGRAEEGTFTALGEWIRLTSVYELLRKLRFFRHFLLCRTFRRWAANVRRSSFERRRAALGRQLFAVSPTFQAALAKAGALVDAMRETAVVAITSRVDRLYSLEEFVSEQDHRRAQVAAPALEELVEKLCGELLAVADRIDMERERMEKLVDIPALRGNEFVTCIPTGPSAGARASPGAAAAAKSKSISALKSEKAAILSTYDGWVAAQARLPAFARLLDYMVACAALHLGTRGVGELLGYLENPAKTRGVLLVTVSFEPLPHAHNSYSARLGPGGRSRASSAANTDVGSPAAYGYGFAPQQREVLESLLHVMDALAAMLAEMPRPSTHKAVATRLISPSVSFLDVATVLAERTPAYAHHRQAVMQHVDTSFVKALDYVRSTFEDRRSIFEFSLSWDPAAYDAAAAATDHQLLPAAFRRDMVQQRRWQRQVDQMKMSCTVGILLVDSKRMRAGLQESIERTMEGLKAALQAAGRRAVAAVTELLHGWERELEPRPPDLDGYAAVRARLAEVSAEREDTYRSVDAASELCELFRDYGGRPDVKDQVALETMQELAAKVRGQLQALSEWVSERSAPMTSALSAASQELGAAVQALLADIVSEAMGDPDANMEEMLDAVASLELRLLEVEELAARHAQYQALFGVPVDEPGNLAHVRREFEHRRAAWVTLAEWEEKSGAWLTQPVSSLDADEVAAQLDELYRAAYRMAKAARDDRVVARLKDSIEAFRKYTPLFTDCCNRALQPHHWQQMFAAMGQQERDPSVPVSISELIEWGALDVGEALSAVSGAASKELSLRSALTRMKGEWEGVEFRMVPYRDSGTCVVGHTDEVQMQLDEQLMKVQAMNASPFVKPFREEAEAWQATLEGLQVLLDGWLSCQATWMYLEPIFSSPDIVKQMPEEGQKFAQVDMTFRLLVDEVVAAPGVIGLAKQADRRESLAEANRLLEEVQRGLARYLELKRLAFPRFFFLSNDEMLEILSETKDPTRVQPHLRKCFEGIHRLEFAPGGTGVVGAMVSMEGERVPFTQPVNTAAARGKVEQWLVEVEQRMFEAVHEVAGRGIADYPAPPSPLQQRPGGQDPGHAGGPPGGGRPGWALRWPGMVVLLAAGVFWTRGVEAALAARRLPDFEQQCSAELRQVVDLVRGELSGLQRATLGALVVLDVHARDVVAGLAADGVAQQADFGWQAQLRTYWGPTDGKPVSGQPARDLTAHCCMMSASLEYGYEYLGNSSRLVITPLTDRCYRTLMGAIHMNLGGAPEGPAGTGKTETTKDLAKALARQCVVFNCSDTLDYQAMAKFFKGLAAAGAWACFDEFNRIDLEVLSVVAQQVLEIQRSIAARLTQFTFEGSELPLKWSAWCAITMNPGYAGRSELPDNLKALFRSVAMMVPDYAMIAEIILYSYGYLAARPAAKKIVACYRLCSEQLSSQDHYDYGMRAVMAVLRAAGNLKRRFAAQSPPSLSALQSPEAQEAEELGLVLRSLVDVNLCKFLSHDVPLFNGIVSDLFPGIAQPQPDYGPLAAALRSACLAASLQPTQYFMLKATQLYEMVLVRHGLMLVGQPFSGKTASYRVLAAALSAMADGGAGLRRSSLLRRSSTRQRQGGAGIGLGPEPSEDGGGLAHTDGAEGGAPGGGNPHAVQVRAHAYVLNPKAVTMGQLYGQFDPASHEWSDGVLAVLFRRCASDPSTDRKWLVLDGPVDAIWIENMNTVLDDNKKLCLNSGEIIAMSAPMNLIFEVGDLAVASPATVSRCGMVYLEPQQLGLGPLLASWLAALPPHLNATVAAASAAAVAAAALGASHSALALPGGAGGSAASGVLGALGLGGAHGEGHEAPLGGLKARLAAFFEGLVVPTIRFVRREVKEAAPSLDANLAVTWMRLVTTMITPLVGTVEAYRRVGGDARAHQHTDALCLQALAWSAGASAAAGAGRRLVDAFVRRAVAGSLAGLEVPSGHHYGPSDAPAVPALSPGALPPDSPPGATLHDFTYDTAAAAWVPWAQLAAAAPPIPASASFASILVPTPDTEAVTFLLRTAIDGRYPFLLVGPTGTGKSVVVQRCLLGLGQDAFAPPNLIGFSAQTSANATQALVDAKLDKRRKGVYGPAGGRRGVVFVDDLNMPQREEYGAQPPIELLRQYMDHGGWYGRDNAFRTIQDVLFVAAMGTPGGGRSPVTNRYTRHFAALCLPEASPAALSHIFGTIHDWFLTTRAFPEPVVELRGPVIAATLEVYASACGQLLPTPAKSHYTFNLRDVARVVQGLQAQGPAALAASVAQWGRGGGAGAVQQAQALREGHLRLWVHEVLRVFYDRLVDGSEQRWLLSLLRSLAAKHFGVQLDALLGHLLLMEQEQEGGPPLAPGAGGGRELTPDHLRRCLFGDYVAEPDAEGVRPYLEVASPQAALSKLEEALLDHNSLATGGRRPLPLALFLYAVEHVTRIARVLRQEGGHVLCVGVGGSGRQSLARLAAFVCGMEAFQVEMSRSYGLSEWRDDLRRLCRRAGAEGRPTVFLFGDSSAAQEAFVEDVNSLLNSGEVPNLFPHDERSAICEAVRASARRADPSAPDSPSALWAHFVARCRACLHVVLCFSPAGDAFRERLRRFPSLVNCCTIDWFHTWPDDALAAVAGKLLAEVDLGPDMRAAVRGLCQTFHSSAIALSAAFRSEAGRPNYVTPTSYLELIGAFGRLLAAGRARVLAQQQKYENGLDKLLFTSEQVAVMRVELQELAPVLSRTVAETEQLLGAIAVEKEQVVEPKRRSVDAEVRQADAAAAAARAIKEECEAILSEALPALQAAIQALDTIKAADIRLVQTFKSPPAAVKVVLEAVCVMLDVKPTMVPDPTVAGRKLPDYWDASKRLLMDPQLIQRLKDYDRDNIPQKTMDRIRSHYTGDPDFTPANAAKASSAAEGLCKWVHAMDAYDRVAKVVAPKRAALAEAEAAYAAVLSGLQAKQAELAELEARLAGLEARLAESQERKQRLEAETASCALKLERAEQLLGGLGGERERWTAAAGRLRASLGGLTGDMLLAAGCVAYLGAFTMPYRDRALSTWVAAVERAGVPTSFQLGGGGAGGFSLTAALGDPVQIREWVIAGLPNDAFSIDSAVIASTARRWPLCIDPQGQANRWIKNMYADRKMKVMKLTDPDYLRVLEAAVPYGLPVLLEAVGEALDPALEPLLLRHTFRQGGQLVMRLGDNVVEYSEDFRLYLTTALPNPHYLPETAVKVTLLNFMITPEGLADQLLGVAVAAEMPALEEARQGLVVAGAEAARQLADIEGRILAVLSGTQGNILEDATAVNVLSEAKRLSDDITAKQAASAATSEALEAARTRYRPLAATAACLFFAIAALQALDHMYQYSLAWFIDLFVRSIHDSAEAAIRGGDTGLAAALAASPLAGQGGLQGAALEARLRDVERHFLGALYRNVCRSLFEKHKLMLSFQLASRLALHRGRLPPEQLRFLLQGGAGAGGPGGSQGGAAPGGGAAAGCPAEIPPRVWAELQALAALPGGSLASLPVHVSRAAGPWAALLDHPEPHRQPLPEPLGSSLTPFQRLLLLRCLRPDKLLPCVEAWVAAELGPAFTAPPPLDLAEAFREAVGPGVPLLWVLSPGTDPWAALLKFAEERGQDKKMQVISLGQGQGPKAAALIEAARSVGAWVLLQNCHLAPSWMSTLERMWEGIRGDNTDPAFRLWLTSLPSPSFPPTLLQAAVKITAEPPAGLRANLRRSLGLEPLSTPTFWGAEAEAGGRAGGKEQEGEQGQEEDGGEEGDGEGEEEEDAAGRTLRRLLFGLVFLHAAVQERRRYGPIGWNVPYGFDDGDLRISARQLRMYVLDSTARGDPVPYAALQYAIGECNYGGRVTDDKDRLLLATLLRRVVCPATVDVPNAPLLQGQGQGHGGLDAGEEVQVVVPEQCRSLKGFLSYVESLPSSVPPDVFGLHANADISKDLATTTELLAGLAATTPGMGGAAGAATKSSAASSSASPTSAPSALSSLVSEALEALPHEFDVEAAAAAYPVSYHQSLNQVLVQEMARYNRLLGALRGSLAGLGRALGGLALMGADVEAVAEAVAAGQVPAAWKAVSYPSLKPLAPYLADLRQRCAMLAGWAADGPPPSFWLGAFFFPPAFTTAALQNYARRHGLPIDAVGFDFEVLRAPDASALTAPAPSGVYVHGLFLEGAGWDRPAGCLCEAAPKQLHCAAPPMWFKTVKLAEIKPSATYSCPVYRTAERRGVLATTGHSTNFLMAVRLPLGAAREAAREAVEAAADHWTLRGVCLLASLPE